MALLSRTILGFTAAAMIGLAGPVLAYPDKPIEYVIPFSPGGESDISARLQQPFFKKMFGQELEITYRPGLGGADAWATLNRTKPDGYTIVGVNLPHIVLQPAQGNAGYKTEDIATVYWFHNTPDAIVVKADSPFKTLGDLVKYAKQRPGQLTFSGSGKDSANHLAQVRFDKMAGIKTNYASFKGTGASNTALLVDQVDAAWGFTTSAIALGKQARVLAVATELRHPKFPDAPTFRELGYDLVSGAYRGIAVPRDTPAEIKKDLSSMIGKINADPEFQKAMMNHGFALSDIPVEKNAAFMKQKTQEFLAAAKEGGILDN